MAHFFVSGPPTYRTDFNKRDAQGRVVAAFNGPAMYWLGGNVAGNRVRLEDAEGNSCEAVVDEIDGQLLRFTPNWETWSDGSSVSGVQEFVFTAATIRGLFEETSGASQEPLLEAAGDLILQTSTAAEVNAA